MLLAMDSDLRDRRKPQQKKHKTWDGDGFAVLKNGMLTLVSERGIVYVLCQLILWLS